MLEDGTVKVFSRNSEETTSKYPDIVAMLPKAMAPGVKSFILDAEAVAYDRVKKTIMPFQVLSALTLTLAIAPTLTLTLTLTLTPTPTPTPTPTHHALAGALDAQAQGCRRGGPQGAGLRLRLRHALPQRCAVSSSEYTREG